jgi:hypothetical protein
MMSSMDNLLKLKSIPKTSFVPKEKISLREYLAIKQAFVSSDFERSQANSLNFPVTLSMLWLLNRVGKRLKFI